MRARSCRSYQSLVSRSAVRYKHAAPTALTFWKCGSVRRFCRAAHLFGEVAEPAQRDRGLRVVRFVAAAEVANAHSREAAFFD
jgi:hypothetical protein